MNVLICDDIPRRGEDAANSIRLGCPSESVEVTSLTGEDLTSALQRLFGAVAQLLPPEDSESPGSPLQVPADFDCDVLVIDNNLAGLDIAGARMTAEHIASYVRAFTKARYIVSLNKNPDVDFDLRYLVGDYQTRADIALNADHLSIGGLWTTGSVDQCDQHANFLPWYWPTLLDAANRRRKQVDWVKTRLEKSVLGELAFPGAAILDLSAHAKGVLYPDAGAADADLGEKVADARFIDFFKSNGHSLPAPRERKQIARSAMDGDELFVNALARIVAADIDRWIRRDVLGPQNVLVDVPHLLMRLPFLLGDGVGDLDGWNAAVNAATGTYGLDGFLYDKHLRSAEFSHAFWVEHPCFWWSQLKYDASLDELFFKPNTDWLDAVFCEDISAFRRFSDEERPTAFSSEFEDGTWNQRHVLQVEGRQYGPKSRFL